MNRLDPPPSSGPSEESITAQVRAAHDRGEGGYRTLAKRFGISPTTAQQYVKGHPAKTWCLRKRRFCSYEEAAAAMLELPPSPNSREVYACTNCGGFHFGHKAK